MKKVKIYTKSYCPHCNRAIGLLDELGVEYENFIIDKEKNGEDEYKKIKEKTQHFTVPQIFVEDKFIGGCDDLFELYENEKLDNLLK